MQNYFALAAPEIKNAQIDTTPIGNALDDYRLRQRQMQQDQLAAEDRQYQRGRNARQDILAAEQRQYERQNALKEQLAKQALAYDQLTDPIQRQAGLQSILREHPNAANLPAAYKDPNTAFKLIAADYGQFRDDLDRQYKQTQIELSRTNIAKARQEMANEDQRNSLVNSVFSNGSQPQQPPTLNTETASNRPTAQPTQNNTQSVAARIAELPPEKQLAAKGLLQKGDYEGFSKLLETDRPIAGGFKDMKQLSDVEEGFRKEFAQVAKPYFEVRDAYNRIQSSGKEPSPAGDLALIFNYMKILDPGSTVREGEFANAQNAAGVPDQIRNQFNKLLTGERLGDAQRADFTKTAERLAKSQERQYQKIQRQYENIAKRKGLDLQNIILDYSAPEDETAPTQQMSGTPSNVAGSVVDFLSTPVNTNKPFSEWSDEEIAAQFARR